MTRLLRYILVALFWAGIALPSHATHNRAGEITYRWLFGYTYEITLVTYTNTQMIGGQLPADRCEDTVHFGDGTMAVVPRSNGSVNVLTSCGPAHDGQMISTYIKKNIYITQHTYSGPGIYTIYMYDPNRNAGVINIPNSVNQPFYLESNLVIGTFSGPNSSPVLTIPPIDNGCVNKCFIHNPGAYDPDGDSLSYELTTCKGTGGQTVPGYSNPAAGAGGIFSVNATTGDLVWCSPQLQGTYNMAMIIREWRKNTDGDWENIGFVLRDLQVDVGVCNNEPPSIRPITDTCVEAGTFLQKIIYAADTFPPSQPDVVTLTANGGPFICPAPNASFVSTPSLGTVQGQFSWQTACVHVRKNPYQVIIKAEDNDPQVQLVDFKTFNITIVGPPPQNLIAQPLGTAINLTWHQSPCQQTTGNRVIYYNIYRKGECTPWVHGLCETGVPAYTGFTLIGHTTAMNDTTFTDNNNGNGLQQGVSYSYLVVAVYADGALSYASNQVCAQLKRDVPIIINADVQSTSSTTGSVFVRWILPLLGPLALDTTQFPGPYEFRLQHYDGFSGTFSTIYSVTHPFFGNFQQLSDTTYTHQNIDTDTQPHTYRVEFYSNGLAVGHTQSASTVFLQLSPSDNKLTLSWQAMVPWTNYKYFIYRKVPPQTTYSLIDSTSAMSYADSNLVNGRTYCYKVQSKGAYSDTTIPRPLFNFSEEECGEPIDKTPPCPPVLSISSDCTVPTATLSWTNPNHFCCDDAVKYLIYYAPLEDTPLSLVDSVTIMSDTILVFDNQSSIAGCYAVTAVDSFGNESLKSAVMCIDNCPEYELPNVITVNNDGKNDLFIPIKNRFIKDIELKIYDRWGLLVFETNDPAINWDGRVIQTHQLCSEGTYFYVCTVNEIRVKGINSRYLKGFVQIFHN